MKKTPPKIFIVEDIPEIRDFFETVLDAEGYETIAAGTCADARYVIGNEPFSLALLDVVLPDGDGVALLKEIRAWRGNVPVIMQTALGEDALCVRALKLGADDFIVKPVRRGPLLARIAAVLRRAAGTPEPFAEIPLGNGARADCCAREILFPDGRKTRLTFKECELLKFLCAKNGAPATLDELLLNVWSANPADLEIACVPALVSRLRRKLDGCAEIRNVYGNGYALSF